jgi:hypothetical protein
VIPGEPGKFSKYNCGKKRSIKEIKPGERKEGDISTLP